MARVEVVVPGPEIVGESDGRDGENQDIQTQNKLESESRTKSCPNCKQHRGLDFSDSVHNAALCGDAFIAKNMKGLVENAACSCSKLPAKFKVLFFKDLFV